MQGTRVPLNESRSQPPGAGKPDETVCTNCGKPVSQDDLVCPHCGISLVSG